MATWALITDNVVWAKIRHLSTFPLCGSLSVHAESMALYLRSGTKRAGQAPHPHVYVSNHSCGRRDELIVCSCFLFVFTTSDISLKSNVHGSEHNYTIDKACDARLHLYNHIEPSIIFHWGIGTSSTLSTVLAVSEGTNMWYSDSLTTPSLDSSRWLKAAASNTSPGQESLRNRGGNVEQDSQ